MTPVPRSGDRGQFMLYVAFAIGLFVGLETIYINKDRLLAYSRVIWIHTGAFLCLAVLVIAFLFVSIMQFLGPKASFTIRVVALAAILAGLLGVLAMPLFIETGSQAMTKGDVFEVGSSLRGWHQVFFPNGKDRPYPADLDILKSALTPFLACTETHIEVFGFASSAPFHNDSNENNRVLANRRSAFIADLVSTWGLDAKQTPWEKFEGMASNRAHKDVTPTGRRLVEMELSNRRVDLVVHSSRNCLNPVSATK